MNTNTEARKQPAKTTAVRWATVIVGLLSAQVLLVLLPRGDMDLFPTAALWRFAFMVALLAVMFGMFFDFRSGSWWPLSARE